MPESRFLKALRPEVFEALRGDLEITRLVRGDILMHARLPSEWVYFPIDCSLSLVVSVASGDMVEAATVGNDGFVGLSAFLGLGSDDLTAIVQIPGLAYRMKMEAFESHRELPGFNEALSRFSSKTLSTITRSIACLAFHTVPERLARWLLEVRDGIERDEFPLTQDYLAVMLGVHRPTVTIAMGMLVSEGLIAHRRGLIRIVDAAALEGTACECYTLAGRS